MKVEFVEQEIWDLIETIANEDMPEGYHMYDQYKNIFVRSKEKLAEMMIRVQEFSDKKRIVVARVSYNNRRKGNLSKLVEMFLKYEYEVVLECPLTDDIFAFMNNGAYVWEQIEYAGVQTTDYRFVSRR